MKKYKLIAYETITHEFIIEAKNFDDAMDWVGKDQVETKRSKDFERFWECESIEEIKETR